MEARMQGRTSMVDGRQRKDQTDLAISAAHASLAKDDGDGTMDHRCGSSSSRGRCCTHGDGGGGGGDFAPMREEQGIGGPFLWTILANTGHLHQL